MTVPGELGVDNDPRHLVSETTFKILSPSVMGFNGPQKALWDMIIASDFPACIVCNASVFESILLRLRILSKMHLCNWDLSSIINSLKKRFHYLYYNYLDFEGLFFLNEQRK